MSVTKPKADVDDLEVEAEKAFQRASVQQTQKEDDFDFEFEGAFQSPTSFPENSMTIKSGNCVSKPLSEGQSASNGPFKLPVKTEGLPSSLPSSQG